MGTDKDTGTGRVRRHFKAFVAADLFLLVGMMLGLHIWTVNQTYSISDSAKKLLSPMSVNSSNVKFNKGTLSYNPGEPTASAPGQATAASVLDAIGLTPYKVSLASSPKAGINFSSTDYDLPLQLVPLTSTSSGNYSDGHMVYPTTGGQSVYTLRKNGIKEDIILNQPQGDSFSFSWKLVTGNQLKAKLLPNGSVGIYTVDPALLSSGLQVDDGKTQALIDKAKQVGDKTHLLYLIPAPYIKQANGKYSTDASFSLSGNVLTLNATKLSAKNYPLTIDPSIVVTTTADFLTGTDDGNINYGVAGEIDRGNISLGTIGTWAYTHSSTNDGGTFSAGFTGPRRYQTTVAYNGYLYVLGGNGASSANDCTGTGTFCNGVQFAPINSNGTVGAWHYTHSSTDDGTTFVAGFIQTREISASVAYNGYLYVIGGFSSTSTNDCSASYCNGVQFAPINSNGTIGTWAYTHNSTNDGTTFVSGFTQVRYGLSSVAYNGYLYVLGGQSSGSANDCASGSNYCNGVQFAPINSDGTVGAWHYTHNSTDDGTTFSAGFTQARASIGAVAYNGYLYIVGGQESANANDCSSGRCSGVQFARINSNGTIGTWAYTHGSINDSTTYVSGFIQARGSEGAVAYNGYLYILGGQDTGVANDCSVTGFCNGVQFAPINANGTIGAWHYTHNSTDDGTTFSAGFTQVRYGLTSVAYNGYLYVIGGSGTNSNDCVNSSSYCNGVQFTTIDTGTPSGFGLAGTWAYTHSNINDGGTYSAGFIQSRTNQASVAYNGFLYVVGGISATSANDCTAAGAYCNGVQFAPINSDGTIGAWHYTHASTDDSTTFVAGFTVSRSQFTSVAYNGYLYVIGGLAGTAASDCGNSTGCNGVQFAPINANGTIGAWHYTHASTDDSTTFVAGFTQPRQAHSTVAYNGFLYVIGGSSTTTANDCSVTNGCNGIQFAPINSNGTIGAWHYTHSSTDDGTTFSAGFNVGRDSHNSVAYNGYLYVIGGETGNTTKDCTTGLCNGVQFAPINSDGTIGAWSYTHGLTNDGTTFSSGFAVPRDGQSTTVYNGFAYVVGGSASGASGDCAGGTFVYCSGVQFAPFATPAQRAYYERVVDTGNSANTISSVVYNGTAPCGASISYATAGSSNIFGSFTSIPNAIPGITYTINQTNERYVLLGMTLDDSQCGGTSKVTDITINYASTNTAPAAPTLSSPSNGASGVTTTPALQLKTTDGDSDYLEYEIQICADSGCGSVIQTVCQNSSLPNGCTGSQTGWSGQDQQTGTAYTGATTLGGSTTATYTYAGPLLNTGTTYYWRGYAIDPGGSNTASSAASIFSFTTTGIPSSTLIQGGTTINGGIKIQ